MEFIILLLTLVATVTAAENCSIAPIYVDIHDRCVDNCFTVQYGLFMGFGNPYQNESLWPSLSHNETTVAGVDYCGDGTSSTCVNQTHGFFSPELSTTFEPRDDYTPLDSSSAISQDISNIEQFGRDTLNIYTHFFDPSPPNLTEVPEYPIIVLSNYSRNTSPWFGPAGLLGLGSTSTLLTTLKDMNLISSRSFGLYLGTAYPRAGGAINGSLTLGGYDSGRITGDAVRYDLSSPAEDGSDPSPYKVQVASISLTDFSNNATTLISSGAFDAYLTTSQYDMTLPDDITQAFIDQTSATPATPDVASLSGADITPLTLPASFSGSLTIHLSSGLNVTLDTPSGTLRNISNRTPLTAPSLDDTTTTPLTPLLGTALLSQLYLTTIYDATPPSFYLSSALPHGPYVITQSLCADSMPIAYQSPRISSFARNGIIGAILGGVIGGIGLVFTVFWGVRKCAQRRASREWEERYGDGDGDGETGMGMGRERGYEVDEFGRKIPSTTSTTTSRGVSNGENILDGNANAIGVAAGGVGGRRARLKGILKPSSHRHRDKYAGGGSGRRKIDKAKNPITAYYAAHNISMNHNTGTPVPKKSWSSSDSDSDLGFGFGEEGYDMSQLQGALPPHSMGYGPGESQVGLVNSGQGAGMGDLGAAAGAIAQAHPLRSPPRQEQQGCETRDPSRSMSRSRSPSPVFSPDERIPSSFTHFSTPTSQRSTQARKELPPSVSFPRRPLNDARSESPYSSMPLTPNTPLPLLSGHQSSESTTHLRPPMSGHRRTSSEERRKQMGLSVKTEFDGPPTRNDRVGKRFKVKEEKVVRKPVSEEHNMLAKIFGR